MDVAVSQLRAHLAEWLERVRGGVEVVVTERGTPVARIVAIDAPARLDELIEQGVISRPARAARVSSSDIARVTAEGSVSDLVTEQRSS